MALTKAEAMKRKPALKPSAMKKKDKKNKGSTKEEKATSSRKKVSFDPEIKYVKYPAEGQAVPKVKGKEEQKEREEKKKQKPVKKDHTNKEKKGDAVNKQSKKNHQKAQPEAKTSSKKSTGPVPPRRLSGKTRVDDDNVSREPATPSPRRELFGDQTSGCASPAISTSSITQLKEEARAAGLTVDAYMEEVSRKLLEEELEKKMLSIANGNAEGEEVEEEDANKKEKANEEDQDKKPNEKKKVEKAMDNSSGSSGSDSSDDSADENQDEEENESEGEESEEEEEDGKEEKEDAGETDEDSGSEEDEEPESEKEDDQSEGVPSTEALVAAVDQHLAPDKAPTRNQPNHDQVAAVVSTQQQKQKNQSSDGISPEFANANRILHAPVSVQSS